MAASIVINGSPGIRRFCVSPDDEGDRVLYFVLVGVVGMSESVVSRRERPRARKLVKFAAVGQSVCEASSACVSK